MIATTEKDERDTVPTRPPYGGPTDGDHVCGRCRESRTGCAICAGEPRRIVKV